MRLIDADELIKQGWRLERHGQSNKLVNVKSIADVPTAFNVEVVIEEMKNHPNAFRELGWDRDYFAVEDAIEVVRRGGVK